MRLTLRFSLGAIHMHIVAVLVDSKLPRSWKNALTKRGFTLQTCTAANRRRAALLVAGAQAVLILLRAPSARARDLCIEFRRLTQTLPIFVVSPSSTSEDRIRYLEAGADDFVSSSINVSELIARIIARRRRTLNSQGTLQHGDLSLDICSRAVFRAGRSISLTRHEFSLLEALLREPHTVLDRERLATILWHDRQGRESNALDVHVFNLRRKINRDSDLPLIQSVFGVGYVLSAPSENRISA